MIVTVVRKPNLSQKPNPKLKEDSIRGQNQISQKERFEAETQSESNREIDSKSI